MLEAPKFVLRVRFAVNLLELIRPQKQIEDAFVFSLLHNCPASLRNRPLEPTAK